MSILYAVLRRTGHLLILIILLTFSTFILSSWIPGDFFSARQLDPTVSQETLDNLRQRYGLDEPIFVQYWSWLKGFIKLDLGFSLFYRRPVFDVIMQALKNTLWIGIPALILGLLCGILIGVFHAIYQQKLIGTLLDILSTVILSLPSIILALTALFFAAHTQWFPIGSMSSISLESPDTFEWLFDRFYHVALPVLCLVIPIAAYVERIQYAATRSSTLEHHLRAARARGLGRSRLFFQHILRPSLNPVIATSGPLFAAVLSGSLIIEIIFTWPGLGQITYDALFHNDLFLLVGSVIASGFLLIIGNLATDSLLIILDPRTRADSSGRKA